MKPPFVASDGPRRLEVRVCTEPAVACEGRVVLWRIGCSGLAITFVTIRLNCAGDRIQYSLDIKNPPLGSDHCE